MDAQRLIQLIRDTALIGSEDLNQLQKVLEKYPFFGIGHLLYLKGLKDSGSGEYNLLLKKSAVHVPDRTVLYNLLSYNRLAGTDTAVQPAEIETETSEAPQSDIHHYSEPVTDPAGEINPDSEITIDIPAGNTYTESTSSVNLDDIFAGIHEDQEDLDFHEVVEEKPENTSISTTLEEASHSFSEAPATDTVKPFFELTETEAIQDTTGDHTTTVTENIEAGEIPEVTEEKKIPPAPFIPAAGEVSEPENQPVLSNRMKLGSFNSWLKQHLEQKNADPAPTQKKDDLIEKFIQEEPRISKPKTEFFNPVDMGKKSLVDDESIVTETLAGVYAAQGDYEKAISTYKKLSLIFPEKSSYFAALIYELEIKQSLE